MRFEDVGLSVIFDDGEGRDSIEGWVSSLEEGWSLEMCFSGDRTEGERENFGKEGGVSKVVGPTDNIQIKKLREQLEKYRAAALELCGREGPEELVKFVREERWRKKERENMDVRAIGDPDDVTCDAPQNTQIPSPSMPHPPIPQSLNPTSSSTPASIPPTPSEKCASLRRKVKVLKAELKRRVESEIGKARLFKWLLNCPSNNNNKQQLNSPSPRAPFVPSFAQSS